MHTSVISYQVNIAKNNISEQNLNFMENMQN